jgi:hypothetical protein
MAEIPSSIVLWEADAPGGSAAEMASIAKSVPARRLVAITENPLSHYQYLFSPVIFGHHILRRYSDPGALMLTRTMQLVHDQTNAGLKALFPPEAKYFSVPVLKISHKMALVEAIENIAMKHGLPGRASRMLSQAADELIMNAVFDAPIDAKGVRYRNHLPRNSNFELTEREKITVSTATCEEYFGLSVTDQWGSVNKDRLFDLLRRNYSRASYAAEEEIPNAGLGLLGIIHSGFSLLFVSTPNVKTEVILLIPRIKSLRVFRTSFRISSFLIDA